MSTPRIATDIYLDAAGAPAVLATVFGAAKHGATIGIVAVHRAPVSIDFGSLVTTELNIVTSMGHPTEMFEVAGQIADHLELFARVVSDRYPFDEVQNALTAASTPGTKGKVVITFDV